MFRAHSASAASRTLAIRLALAVAGTVLLTVSAKIAVPMLPVPITMQTLAIPLLVLALGRNLAVTSTLTYLAAGALGAPVFAPVADPVPALIGGMAGYLWMYPVAAYVMGTLLEGGLKSSWAGRWTAIAAGDLVIFGGGAAWLGVFAHLSLAQTLALGVTPFIIGDLLKITIASALPSKAAAIAARFQV
jgi:biotin transport system substrate-specific component